MAEHKHAAVLRAIADGKEAQFLSVGGGTGGGWYPLSSLTTPLSDPHLEWRIKPEPKPDVVLFYRVTAQSNSYEVTRERTPMDNLRLTFDGETGKLKSAEVLS